MGVGGKGARLFALLPRACLPAPLGIAAAAAAAACCRLGITLNVQYARPTAPTAAPISAVNLIVTTAVDHLTGAVQVHAGPGGGHGGG